MTHPEMIAHAERAAALHEQHKARVLGIACSTCHDVGVTGDTCAALGHDPGTTRQHHSEATDALVVEALTDCILVIEQMCGGCYEGSASAAEDKARAALKALGK